VLARDRVPGERRLVRRLRQRPLATVEDVPDPERIVARELWERPDEDRDRVVRQDAEVVGVQCRPPSGGTRVGSMIRWRFRSATNAAGAMTFRAMSDTSPITPMT
jgi:hypothetical protein